MSDVTEVLAIWREAEQVLAASLPGGPDHDAARRVCREMRHLHRRLTQGRGSADTPDHALVSDAIASARSGLAHLRPR